MVPFASPPPHVSVRKARAVGPVRFAFAKLGSSLKRRQRKSSKRIAEREGGSEGKEQQDFASSDADGRNLVQHARTACTLPVPKSPIPLSHPLPRSPSSFYYTCEPNHFSLSQPSTETRGPRRTETKSPLCHMQDRHGASGQDV